MDTENSTESIRYAVTDIQGSVTEVYDEDNRLLWKSGYTAFGIKAGETTDLIDFDGLYTVCDYDTETGLTYHWNRWRSEDGSTLLSEDPARDGVNWYGYAGQNPINFIDSNGLAPYVNGIYDGPYDPDYTPEEQPTEVGPQLPTNQTRDSTLASYSSSGGQYCQKAVDDEIQRKHDEYAKEINEAQMKEIKRILAKAGYDTSKLNNFNLLKLDQKTVGKRLGINGTKACLVTCWMIMYVLQGATIEQSYEVMEKEIANGKISKDKSEMKDQLHTSEEMAKVLKGGNYDKTFLQSPWKNKSQVKFKNKDDFKQSEYKMAFVKYKSALSNEPHWTLLVNNNGHLQEYDPWPGGIESLSSWSAKSIDSIEPKGWYRR